jgi:hypothetical protein
MRGDKLEGMTLRTLSSPNRWSRGVRALAIVAGAAALWLQGPATMTAGAQADSPLSGAWVLDRDVSQFPREVGFGADFLPLGRGDTDNSSGGGGRGRRGGGGGGGRTQMPALKPQGESFDDAQRRQVLTDEVRTPPARLTVVDTTDTVTITDDKGGVRTLHPDGRAETLSIGGASILTVAHREAEKLIVLYAVADLRQIRYTYSRPAGTASLAVDVEFLERSKPGDTVRRVYNTTGADGRRVSTVTANSGSGSTTPGDAPGKAGAPPSAMPRAGSEFTGLLRLGVVVEELSSQAQGCGLTKAALEGATSKPFTDAGLKVSRNSDEDTYVYVSLMTSTMPTGMCITRFDWSIYSTTDATLSYQRTPLLAQVLLAHKGGLTGSLPATHPADVMRGLSDGLTQIAGIIRDANK